MYVDASAIVAILAEEPLSDALERSLKRHTEQKITSPLAVYEATLGTARVHLKDNRRLTAADIESTVAAVTRFLKLYGIDVIAADRESGNDALLAAARFGKAVGHPADLNFGDCFAYAMARASNVPILCIGNDFSRTDLEIVAL
jgi:ribonuclease VapC